MRAILLGLFAAVLLIKTADAADDSSANYMLSGCQERLARRDRVDFTNFKQFICLGQVDALAYVGKTLPQNISSCRPDGSTREQMLRIVVTYTSNAVLSECTRTSASSPSRHCMRRGHAPSEHEPALTRPAYARPKPEAKPMTWWRWLRSTG
jgi:hypothetical protein